MSLSESRAQIALRNRLGMDRVEFNAVYNTPERMLDRGSYLTQTASNTAVRLTEGEREYLEWLVAERKDRAA
jgi:hypothetical protein